ncbi:MAG: DinB family protein [Spirochaetales bacterium]
MDSTTGTAAVQLLAWYNQRANEALHDVLDGLDGDASDLATRPGTTWIGSILDVLAHVVFSDIAWMRRLWPERVSDPELTLPAASKFDNPFESLGSWWEARTRTDSYIVSVVVAVSVESLNDVVRYQNLKGEPFAQKRWECLLHVFNHETHHRGQVIQVLDEHEVENDISNLIFYVRDRDRSPDD